MIWKNTSCDWIFHINLLILSFCGCSAYYLANWEYSNRRTKYICLIQICTKELIRLYLLIFPWYNGLYTIKWSHCGYIAQVFFFHNCNLRNWHPITKNPTLINLPLNIYSKINDMILVLCQCIFKWIPYIDMKRRCKITFYMFY